MINNESNLLIKYRLCLSQLADMTNRNARSERLNALLKQEIKEKDARSAVEIAEKDRLISEFAKRAELDAARINCLEQSMKELSDENASLRNDKAGLERECTEMRAEITELKERMPEYEKLKDIAEFSGKMKLDLQSIIDAIVRRIFFKNSDQSRFLNETFTTDDADVSEAGLCDAMSQLNDEARAVLGDAAGKAATPEGTVHPDDADKATKKPVRKGSWHGPRKRYTVTAKLLEHHGVDTSNMPKGFRIIMRKGKEDKWTISVFIVKQAEVYRKDYDICRCNVPGSDPQSSKYPDMIVGHNPLMPSFCRFYLDMKFGFHMSENRIVKLLKKMGMKVPKSTLNNWMQQIMGSLCEKLSPVMLEKIRKAVYTQNDESRIIVRSRKSKDDKWKYNVEYIHAALAPELRLCVMEYKDGTRNHSVQEDAIFKDSCIKAFTADRAVLYETIVKDLSVMSLVRSACWFHARHRFKDAYWSDHRVELVLKMIGALFDVERLAKGKSYKTRYRLRQQYSKVTVDNIMKLLHKMQLDNSYGTLVKRAVNYVLNDEAAFRRFLDDGRIEMHNNAVERMFRHLAMGRRNWLHTGSHKGAENIAFMFSLYESCQLNNIDFGEYVEDILTRIKNGDDDYMSMIPCEYKPREIPKEDAA